MEQMVQGILVVNTETIPGMMITETLGVVSGSTVRAKNIGRDITQGLRNIMGGELVKYTELLGVPSGGDWQNGGRCDVTRSHRDCECQIRYFGGNCWCGGTVRLRHSG